MAAFAYYDYGTSATTTIVTFAISSTTIGSNFDFLKPDPQDKRQRQLREWTLAALAEARLALRTSQVDPTGLLPRRPRRRASERLHERPRIRGRVCAGSSRYRVLRA